MKKLFIATLFIVSFNANAFLDFNSYGSGYDDNNWPIWTPMFWMEKVTDNGMFGNKNNQGYGYPYNNQPYNVGASRFNMNQMPTPDQAYRTESGFMPHLNFMTPAAQSFVNPSTYTPTTSNNKIPSPYQDTYQIDQLPSPYSQNYRLNSAPNPYSSWF
ncbi:hypothetical protein [Candidatus Thioglobus sp.]|jgi:hypothetical protein|uniref:hypothetical protein n=1 Tax=Candidatus Thioglobus sp. TaxID=2026721 RepID=UPI0001BD3893|nr:hypothetical protein [Candidatus Thioglobus sp.]EEZ79620.1 MAG: hypothetical protein Sup05_0997 [uncultured Candidatus Thioglobus sp.]MBT3186879.1 hypothetical protein [Candidatus Thioglobus sp.]MBT3431693.1 hypothetical protein [Candidatus Thioglobus sp.]MBT3965005.1 hypothetical protein [Candidatus Thioglobus sp.]MBT4923872.1 hypothetical protein [Candidatus Thioglobus sp.]